MEDKSMSKLICEINELNLNKLHSKELYSLVPYFVDRIEDMYHKCLDICLYEKPSKKCSKLANRIINDIRSDEDVALPAVYTDTPLRGILKNMHIVGYNYCKLSLPLECRDGNCEKLVTLLNSFDIILDNIDFNCTMILMAEPATKKSYKLAEDILTIIRGNADVSKDDIVEIHFSNETSEV